MSMAMLDTYAYFVLLYTLAAPALPWLFARKRDASAIWGATGLTVIFLILFSTLLWPACIAANCGQGGILVLALWSLAGLSSIVTLAVTAALVESRE